MSSDEEFQDPDFGLVSPITLPAGAKVPDRVTGRSTPEEYDQYFRILREQQGLVNWSNTCVSVLQHLLDDLAASTLDPADERDILRGYLIVMQTTLMRWVKVMEADNSGKDDR